MELRRRQLERLGHDADRVAGRGARRGGGGVAVRDELHQHRVARALLVERQERLLRVAVLVPTEVLDAGAMECGVDRGDGALLGLARRAGLLYRGVSQIRGGDVELLGALDAHGEARHQIEQGGLGADRGAGRDFRRVAALAELGEYVAHQRGLDVVEGDRRRVRVGEVRERLDADRVLLGDLLVHEDLRAGLG